MRTIYFAVECPKCDEDILYPCGTTEEHNGHPVVPFDMMAQTRVDCDHCDATIWFGDFDETMYVEGEDDEEEAS